MPALSPRNLTTLPADRNLVAPSLLAADFAHLADEVDAVTCGGADMLHVDIMDGHFVPNLSMGPGIVKSIRPHSDLPFDVHLMLSHPRAYVEPFASAGADHITIHVEAEDDVAETLQVIRDNGCSCGLSVRPNTPADAIYPWLDQIDLVLVMTVEPGFGGQSFMEEMMPKVRALRERIDAQQRPVHLQVDGGISAETALIAGAAGANIFVAGTKIFRADDGPAQAITAIRG